MSTEGTIVAVCVSEGKGTPKRAISEGQLVRIDETVGDCVMPREAEGGT